ncbi:MAG: dihydrodipicolinate synthase family protein [Planctomycetota bacterium]|nr:dihydrodipicolinate synthase family protein [Planctomycetota bacterium]
MRSAGPPHRNRSTVLHGVVVPAITPVGADDRVDERAFRNSLRRLAKAGVHGIFVGGSAGEGPLLTDREWRRMAEIAFDEVGRRLPLLGGAIDTSTRRVCDKVRALREVGYRHAVVTPTFYIAAKTPSEHLRLFGAARDAAGDMELVAYNIPGCTGSTVAVDTFCAMAKRRWIRCCKESSGDFPYLLDLIRRGADAGLSVLAGDEKTSGRALLAGACGIVPVCANYDPETFLRLYAAGRAGNRAAVARHMKRVNLLRDTLPLSGPCWLAGIKYAVSVLGIGSGLPISPLEPASAGRKKRIDALIESDRRAGIVKREGA